MVAVEVLVNNAETEQVLNEASLIQAAAQRNTLKRRQPQELTRVEQQIIRRGERALHQLLASHRRLIKGLVSSYQGKGYNSANTDLELEANLAFFNAVATYDPTKGSRLGTWAYYQIRARLQQITGWGIKEAVATAKAVQSQPAFSEPEPIPEQTFLGHIRSTLSALTEKQQAVVSLHLQGLSWVKIAEQVCSTADAVRMLWNRAVKRLRLLLGESQHDQQAQVVPDRPTDTRENQGQPLLNRLYRRLSQFSVNLRSELISFSKNKVLCPFVFGVDYDFSNSISASSQYSVDASGAAEAQSSIGKKSEENRPIQRFCTNLARRLRGSPANATNGARGHPLVTDTDTGISQPDEKTKPTASTIRGSRGSGALLHSIGICSDYGWK